MAIPIAHMGPNAISLIQYTGMALCNASRSYSTQPQARQAIVEP